MNDEFIENITAFRGGAGKKWLDSIPKVIEKYKQRWSIEVFSPFTLSYNYVAPAKRKSGASAVLKIGFPGDQEFITEAEALRRFNGQGMIKRLEADLEGFVLLLEKAEPGQALKIIQNDDEVTRILAGVLKQLDKPIADKAVFPSLADWGQGFARTRVKFGGTSGLFPKYLFEKAEEIFKQYTQAMKKDVLLHGDLHNDNILLSQRGWLAIDPKGVVGEAEFEPAAFLRNPYYDLSGRDHLNEIVRRRIAQLSEYLGFDKQKIQNWAMAAAVLSAIWVLEDQNKYSSLYIQNAELLSELKV